MNDVTLQERLHVADALGAPGAAGGDTLDIVEYWHAIAKRRWPILGLTLLIVILTTLVVTGMQPRYRATTTLLIEQGKSKVVSIEEVYSQGLIQREYFQTQVEILKSDELARKVVQKLELTKHPEYDPRQQAAGPLSRMVTAVFGKDETLASDEDILKTVVAKFKKNVTVQLVRNSQLVQITFISADKELAAKVPNALADVYIENDLDARMAMTQKASEWLRDRLGELRGKVDASERALQEYRDRQGIVDAKGVAMSGASKQLEELTKSLVDARQRRAEAETGYNLVQQARSGRSAVSYDSIPAVLKNPLVARMKEAEADAEKRLSDVAKRYGPEHPKMIQAKAELDAVRQNTRKEIDTVVAGIAKEYEIAKANETAVERALAQSKADIQNLNRKDFQLGVLQRDVDQNRNLYEMFVNRLKETSAAGDMQSTIARVVDPAQVPTSPYAPNKKEIVAIAAAVTLVLAAMLALLLDRLSNTLNSTSDVEGRLGVPALGVLQKIKGFVKKGFISELAFFNDTQSTFAEAVRTVRTSVLMSSLDDPHKVVVVTSSVPEEGKTTLSFNLACALGQVKKVLLVDGDLRRPKIGKLVGRDRKLPGLADLVAGQAQVSQCVFFDDRAGIHILPAGTVPPNPLELLSSKRFADVLTKLKEAFDIVILDSAPLQLVSDAQVLSQFASSVIYVVKADATPYQVAQNGIKKLRRVDAPILGVVLNQLDLEKAEKYYGEYSGYKSYKGYKKYGYTKTYGWTWNYGWTAYPGTNCASQPGVTAYGYCSGTSMSAPMLAGSIGVLRSANPLLTDSQTKTQLAAYANMYGNSSSQVGAGVPNVGQSVQNALYGSGGNNGITPLFILYHGATGNHFYTTVPQMATAAMSGTLKHGASGYETSAYASPSGTRSWEGSVQPGYTYPGAPAGATAVAAVDLFTTVSRANQALTPLYRMSWSNPATGGVSHVYTSDATGISQFKSTGYVLDGIEGYVYPTTGSRPAGTVKLLRRYNPTLGLYAFFPESQASNFQSDGYTTTVGNDFVGYVCPIGSRVGTCGNGKRLAMMPAIYKLLLLQ